MTMLKLNQNGKVSRSKNKPINYGLFGFAILGALFAAYLVLPGVFPNISSSLSSAAFIQCPDIECEGNPNPQGPFTGDDGTTTPPPTAGANIIGYHDGATGTTGGTVECNAYGWATNTQNTSSDLTVRVLSDGNLVLNSTVVADGPRSDLGEVCSGGTCAFNIYLDGKITPNVEHRIEVQARNPIDNTWVRLGTSPKNLTCRSSVAPPSPPEPTLGCIDVIKETFDTAGNPITPVAQFTFRLNNNEQVRTNDGTGRVRFNNVNPGSNTVREDIPFGWSQTSVTPAGGVVNVQAGSSCAVVVFKNRQTTPTAPRPLAVSCFASPGTARIGQNITWTANASNGVGSYTYSWTGTDGLSGTTRTVNKIYQTLGQKSGTVTVTSGSETRTATCFANIIDDVVTPPALSGSCSASPSVINIGGSANWMASVSGGDGTYSYSWSGTDGLSGNTSSLNRSYGTSGTKNASVVITSGNQSITRNCSLVVQQAQDPVLSGNCTVSSSPINVGDTASWTANPSGGNGIYSYSWSGTDGLSGSGRTVARQYNTAGTKSASVVITSGSQSITRNCSLVVVEDQDPVLSATCSVLPSVINTNDTATWTANPSGGNGIYSYSWSGTDGLTGAGRSVTRQYTSPGTKTGTVVVTSGSQSVTRNCSLTVEVAPQILDGSCFATPGSAMINDTIIWTANATGATGAYSYSWSGAANGSGRTVNQTYGASGTQTATVTITSGNQSINRTCSVLIQQSTSLSGSCFANPSVANLNQNIAWSANVSGGTGSYNYSWSGDASGSGQTVNQSYGTSGNKYATVVITSGGQSITRNCSAFVENITSTSLNVSCNSVYNNQNRNVVWTSNIFGGTGSYNYYWSGTDGLTGNSQTTSMTYPSSGIKYATINVVSGGQSASATCQVNLDGASGNPNVTVTSLPFAGPNPLSFVYLSQLPYTGLLSSSKSGLFPAILIIWSAIMAYILLKYIEKKKKGLSYATSEVSNSPSSLNNVFENFISKSTAALGATTLLGIFAPTAVAKKEEKEDLYEEEAVVPEEDEDEEIISEEMDSVIESIGNKERVLFSEKAKRMIVKSLKANESILEKLAQVIKTVSLSKPREYGWLSVNQEILEKVI